ncbi:hypothetical protein CTAYLR_009210 [Chrysophaeum taylorii]|uniref:SH3 domain-containing protein n=1 Tax=Chrysophaeum taylorii TaxID=2483200 RepID=A0AAD7U9I2_9STRA|nr:hypothetical protein CTAYLR_009210 [Chrysophaeum taylorii]
MTVWARALYDYTPEEPGELELRKGDLIEIRSREDENWWQGTIDDRDGEFPSNYVEVVNYEPEGLVFPSSPRQHDRDDDDDDDDDNNNAELEASPVQPPRQREPSPPEETTTTTSKRIEESPLWNGRTVVAQQQSPPPLNNLRDMRAAVAAAEAEQADLAERAKALRAQQVDDVPPEEEEAEDEEQEEEDFVETESAARLREAVRLGDEAEARKSVKFERSAAEEELENKRRELEAAAEQAEIRRARAEAAAARARATRVEEERKAREFVAVRKREEAAAAVANESSTTAVALATSSAVRSTADDQVALNAVIARMVEERVKVELAERDAVLRDIREAMARLEGEVVATRKKATVDVPPRSSRSEGDTKHHHHAAAAAAAAEKRPLKLPAVVDDGAGTKVTGTTTSAPQHATRRRPQRRRASPNNNKEAPEFDENLPRVANLRAGVADKAKQAQEAQALRDLAAKAAVRYARCKSVVFAPDVVDPEAVRSAPDSELALDYVFAYSGEPRRKVSIGRNAVWSVDGGRAIYPAAGVVVAHDLARNCQSFFAGHAGDAVTALARHPNRDVFATGQAAKRPKVCVWALGAEVPAPIADLQLPSGSRFVSLIRFSPCGRLLLTLGADEGHTFTLWNWQRASPLLSQRAGVQPVYGLDFHPTLVVLAAPKTGNNNDDNDVLGDLGPGDAHYAFASCGFRTFKFWTLTIEADASALSPPVTRQSPSKAPKGGVGSTATKWRCEGFPATAGRAHQGELQNVAFTALVPVVVESAISRNGGDVLSPRSTDEPTFVPDACYVAGTDRGALALWQQAEDDDAALGDDELRWLPRGKCLASAKAAHEGAVLCVAASRGRGAALPPRVTSAGKDGRIKVFLLVASSPKRPVELVGEVVVATHAPVLGAPRSLCFDESDANLLVGTQGNALAVVEMPPWDGGGGVATRADDDDLRAAFADNARRASAAYSDLSFHIVIHGHVGHVHQVAAHPTIPLVASVGSDKTLRLWDTAEHRLSQLLRLPERALAIAFDPAGATLALGCENGDVLLATCEHRPPATHSWRLAHKRRVVASKRATGRDNASRQPKLKQGSVDEAVDHDDDQPSTTTSTTMNTTKAAVLAVAFSPDSTKLAAACADKCIHVFGENYRKRTALLKGHSTAPIKLDFDHSSTLLQSNDLGRELFFWDIQTGKQVTNAFSIRNTTWATWTCTLGWAVHGVATDAADDVRAVARSNQTSVLLAPGPRNAIRISRFPTLPGAPTKTFYCHSKPISALAFSSDDNKCFSAGGADAAIVQWAHHAR